MLYFITQSHIFISNDPWVIVTRLKAKEYFRMAAAFVHCYIAFPQKWMFFFSIFYSIYILSGPMSVCCYLGSTSGIVRLHVVIIDWTEFKLRFRDGL